MYDDFFGIEDSEQFAFYRVPKLMFKLERFKCISSDAKLLYGLCLDRMTVSQKNGWVDKLGRVYIIYTIEEIMEALNCGNKKAIQLLNELENKANLICRKKQGLGKPNLLYVKKFVSVIRNDPADRHFLKCENDTSVSVEMTSQEMSKAHSNYTNKNYHNDNYNNSFPSSANDGKEYDGISEYQKYYDYFYENLAIEYLKIDYPYDGELLENILELIVETMCSRRKMIRIASDDKPIEVVKSRFMKLNSEHIKYVIDCFKKNTTKIRNIKQYLLATVYNAPVTIDGYFDALVRHDEASGIWMKGGNND